jgi:hypothetical protein
MMKGSAWAWVVVTALVFMVGFVWIVMSQVYVDKLFPFGDEAVSGHVNATNTLTHVKNVWNYWPLITIFVLIIYGIARSLKKEPDSSEFYMR